MTTYREFFRQFSLLYRPFEHHLNLQLAKHGLYRAQWTIIYYLSNQSSATLVELSNYQNVEKPTVTRTINRLEELRIVEQMPSKDKREKRIQLTLLGKQVYEEVRLTVDKYEQHILKGISESDQLNSIRLMEEIRKNILTKGEHE
ncbi:MarR family winged helix-turn-helix transcriptional regulator [Psychrobacillus sp. FJAT-21963]|uniref:MarR family winged helix-turn-helix transcriptional regulator n=1 Tax=Psychrobacillus sp. FJAT-21963 TaxID=1712028 RepID=UPI0006FEACA9|nr:MarR family transcriptional regulator [Psychrobacillus sp. FJAT-21963]KQL34680.1 MarR family transcriptional regulator [Psychrobacillus sp. FJAT-21963]